MSYRDVVIGSARAHLTNPDARGQSIAWFNSMVVAEKTTMDIVMDLLEKMQNGVLFLSLGAQHRQVY